MEYLCFADPDGLDLALSEDPHGSSTPNPQPTSRTLLRLRSVEVQVQALEDRCRALTTALGFQAAGRDGPVVRYRSSTFGHAVSIDLLCAPDQPVPRPRPGQLLGFTWRVADHETLALIETRLVAAGFSIKPYGNLPDCCSIDVMDAYGFEIAICAHDRRA